MLTSGRCSSHTTRRSSPPRCETVAAFFDRIESSPLTDEQAHAVVCFDNRVQVLAAAGSGKTSVMVARAAYAIRRGFVAPERILLLAFNKAAAAELQERIDDAARRGRHRVRRVRASTFHSFGLDVIGKATGEKPRLAPGATDGRDARDGAAHRRRAARPSTARSGTGGTCTACCSRSADDRVSGEPDGYDKRPSVTGFRTFVARSSKRHGERMIADWLYLNGVRLRVRAAATSSTSRTQTHSQYRPTSTTPTSTCGTSTGRVDRDGKPPAEFEGYAEGMAWKRQLHAQHRTTLIETTWADVMFE